MSLIKEIVQKEALRGADVQLHDLNNPLNLKPKYYELIFSTVTLQFLNPQRIPALLTELQEATKTNGYHFLVVPIQSETYPLPDFFTFLPHKEELYHLYQDSGWSILEYKESVGHLHKQDEMGKQISGVFCVLLAQKR